jgi:hypothetical protein
MDFGAAFSYITEDENWIQKILIAGLLSITGIGAIVVIGWVAEIAKRVANGEPEPLPDWSNFGEYVMNGLKILVASFVWSLPIILLIGCLAAVLVGASTALSDSDGAATVAAILNICVSLIAFVYAILISLLQPALIGLVGEGGDWAEVINPRRAIQLFRANIGGFLIALFVAGIVLSILPSIGVLLCFVGVIPALAFGYAVMGHLYGQAYRDAKTAAA